MLKLRSSSYSFFLSIDCFLIISKFDGITESGEVTFFDLCGLSEMEARIGGSMIFSAAVVVAAVVVNN